MMSVLTQYVKKMAGGGTLPGAPKFSSAVLAGVGGMMAIATVASITDMTGAQVLMAPFGASCFLAFAVPDSPLAQPRNIVFGHIVSVAVGLVVMTMIGTDWFAMSLAVGLAIVVMQMTRTGHAPAAADPLVVMMTTPTWEFLIYPTFIGAVLVVLVAIVFNNFRTGIRYPAYWW